jgi:hypothetical protein
MLPDNLATNIRPIRYENTTLKDPNNGDFDGGIWFGGVWYRSYHIFTTGMIPPSGDQNNDRSTQIIYKQLKKMWRRIYAITGGRGTLAVLESPHVTVRFPQPGHKWRRFHLSTIFVHVPEDYEPEIFRLNLKKG